MSTVAPALSREIAAKARERGAQMLDAPVSGSVSTLEAGEVSIMCAGDEATFHRVTPVLQAIGKSVDYVGENGLAVLMKIAANLSLAVQMLAFSEGVLLAEKGGVQRETAVRVLLNSVIASPMLKYRGPFALDLPEEAWFNVGLMQKDLRLALDAGQTLGVPLPTTAITDEFLSAARGMGLQEEDFAAVFRVLATLAGV